MSIEDPLITPRDSENYHVVQSVFFLVAYSAGLGILGSTYTLGRLEIDSLLADIIIMFFIVLTYLISHHMIAYCSRESPEKYNFAEYLEENFGRLAALAYDVMLSVHNIILLAYIQFFLAHFMVENDGTEGNGDRAYYFLAVVNIPLILASLLGDFKKNKWFCVALLIAWVYVFLGRLIETSYICTFSQYWDGFHITSSEGFGSWVFKLIGLQMYFASAFQSLPFIYKEVKNERTMNKVINLSAVITLIIYLTVYIFYTFEYRNFETDDIEDFDDTDDLDDYELENNTTALSSLNCRAEFKYKTLSNFGRVFVGACGIIINVIPARFALAQLLSGNDASIMQKVSSSDKAISGFLIVLSIILALFMFNKTFWGVVLCLGVVLTSILAVFVPMIATLFTEEYSKILMPNREVKQRKNRNEKPLLNVSDKGKKVFVIFYIVWASVLTLIGITSGVLIMIDSD